MLSVRLLARSSPLIRALINESCPARTLRPSNQLLPPTTRLLQPARSYAKGKDKKKENKGKTKVEINENYLREYLNYDHLVDQMTKASEKMKEDYIRNLSLRSTTGAIETLKVNVEGDEHELQELGEITRKNPKVIIINMTHFPQTIPAVLQAIADSGMNLNPQQDGTTIAIPVPKVTKEHRENLAKNAKALFIKCRDTIRDAKNEAVKKLKRKTEGISEEDRFRAQKQVEALAEQYAGEAEKLYQVKKNELLGGGDK